MLLHILNVVAFLYILNLNLAQVYAHNDYDFYY